MYLKRKLTRFFVGLISFVCLFYYHEPGGNVLIFCTLAWWLTLNSQGGLKVYKNDTGFWLLSIALWMTTSAYTFYGDPGSMLALLLCFYSLGVYMTNKKFHPLLYPLLLAYSFGTFIVRIFFVQRWIPQKQMAPESISTAQAKDDAVAQDELAGPKPAVSWLRTWLLPIVIVFIFLMVYMASSTLLSSALTNLLPNLDFTVLFALSIIGFFLLFNFMYVLPIKWLDTINAKLLDQDKAANTEPTATKKPLHPYGAAHQKGAILTLRFLIGLLSLFLLLYGYELYQGIHAARLSSAIHEQVNSLILSIVMAVAVIMYYIRPGLNHATQPDAKDPFKHRSKPITNRTRPPLLHRLAYVWIILNVLLVLSAGLHNAAYIGRYGLTLLRIGVYIFLLLCVTGLYFTYRKIRDGRSAAALVATMFKIFLAVIALNSVINWSAIITRYNLTYVHRPDLKYLRYLDFNIHILAPRLLNNPNYTNNPKLMDKLLNKMNWNLSYSCQDPLSVAWYYKYAAWQLRKKGLLHPKQMPVPDGQLK